MARRPDQKAQPPSSPLAGEDVMRSMTDEGWSSEARRLSRADRGRRLASCCPLRHVQRDAGRPVSPVRVV